MLETIRQSLKVHFDDTIVDELLEEYEGVKRRFYAGDFGPQAVSGGFFCETALKLLLKVVLTNDGFTQFYAGRLNVDSAVRRLENERAASESFTEIWQQDVIGFHIPRALRLIYTVRNKRGAAHSSESINPNYQDAILVVTVLDWVMAEFVRLSHDVSPDNAQQIVQKLVTRKVPVIQDFDGFPKILKRDLSTHDCLLILLYSGSASFTDLRKWLPKHLQLQGLYAINELIDVYRFVHKHELTPLYEITAPGMKYVEDRKLLEWS